MLTLATAALAVWAALRVRATFPIGALSAVATARVRRRRQGPEAAALPEAIDTVAAAVRSGRSIHDGLVVAADAVPPRLAVELRQVVAANDGGLVLVDALDGWATTTTLPGAELLASAVGLTGTTGGDVAGALGGVADTLRERRALAREIRALSSQARMSAAVIAVAPLGFAALATITDGDTARFLFGSLGGALCLAVGIGLDLLGWRWMGRIAASVGDR